LFLLCPAAPAIEYGPAAEIFKLFSAFPSRARRRRACK